MMLIMNALYVHYISKFGGHTMTDAVNYQKLYSTLFNAITDAIEKIDALEIKDAKRILMQAQQKTEELYLTEQ